MMGKNPTRRQKSLLKSLNLNPSDWLICKDGADELVIKNRHTDQTRSLSKELLCGR